MYCPQCGNAVPDGAAFCPSCGAEQGPQRVSQSAQAAQAAKPPRSAPHRVLPASSCLAAAWSDLVSSPNWFGRIVLLGLVSAVPVLGFFSSGYALRWARRLLLGERSPMPTPIFETENFVIGFYAFVVSLIAGVVGVALGMMLGWIPIVGIVLSQACMLALLFFADIMMLRVAVTGSLGAAFSFGKIGGALSRSPGALVCAYIVPAAVNFAVQRALDSVSGLFHAAMFLGMVGSWFDVPMGIGLEGLPARLAVSLLVGLVIWVVSAFVGQTCSLVAYRGIGHWAACMVPEWAGEAPERRGSAGGQQQSARSASVWQTQPPAGTQQVGWQQTCAQQAPTNVQQAGWQQKPTDAPQPPAGAPQTCAQQSPAGAQQADAQQAPTNAQQPPAQLPAPGSAPALPPEKGQQ